jgi:hypothetical protein
LASLVWITVIILTIEIIFGMLMFPFQTSMIIHQLVSRWFTKLFNEKNTEISVKANAYLDQWRPIYPIYENMHSMDQFSEYRILFRRSCIRSKWC